MRFVIIVLKKLCGVSDMMSIKMCYPCNCLNVPCHRHTRFMGKTTTKIKGTFFSLLGTWKILQFFSYSLWLYCLNKFFFFFRFLSRLLKCSSKQSDNWSFEMFYQYTFIWVHFVIDSHRRYDTMSEWQTLGLSEDKIDLGLK